MLQRVLSRSRPLSSLPSSLLSHSRTSHRITPTPIPLIPSSRPAFPRLLHSTPIRSDSSTRLDDLAHRLETASKDLFSNSLSVQVKEEVYHSLKKEIGLLGMNEIQGGLRWRNDVTDVISKWNEWEDISKDGEAKRMETLNRLVEGRGTPRTDSPSTTPTFLDGIIRPNTLSSDSPDFSSLIKLIHTILSFREYEAKILGRLLDPNARSLLISCRNFILDKDARRSSALSSSLTNESTFQINLGGSKGIVRATPEQHAFIHSPLEEGVTRASAHAGTGKTAALQGFLQFIGRKRGVTVLATTVRLKNELKDKSEDLAVTKTLASIPRGILRKKHGERFDARFEDKVTHDVRELGWQEVGRLLGISIGGKMPKRYPIPSSGTEVALETKRYLAKVLATFENFCNSSRRRVSTSDVPATQPHQVKVPDLELVQRATTLAERVFSMTDLEAPIPFSACMKLVQLERESTSKDIASVIVVDEAQDLNACELDFVQQLARGRRLVLIGDPLQAIYHFSGAHNQWHDIEGADDYSLTQTRRFGPNIAAAVNEILIYRGVRDLIKPCDVPSTLYRPSNYKRSSGELTIYPVYHHLFTDFLLNRHRFQDTTSKSRFITSERFSKKRLLRLFQHAAHLVLNKPFDNSGTPHYPYPHTSSLYSSSLRGFRNLASFVKEIESWAEDLPRYGKYSDWSTLILLFRLRRGTAAFQHGLAKFIVENEKQLRKAIVTEGEWADETLSISYQFKGFEHDTVIISDYFSSQHIGDSGPLSESAAELLHVAMTRATRNLHVNQALAQFYFEQWGSYRFSLLDNTKETVDCSICRKPSSHDLIGYSTPLPYHPQHTPEPSLDEFLPSTSTISQSDLPICTTCASKSTDQSLRDLATHVEGGTVDSTTAENDDITSVAEALSKTSEMSRRRKEALSEEMDRTTF